MNRKLNKIILYLKSLFVGCATGAGILTLLGLNSYAALFVIGLVFAIVGLGMVMIYVEMNQQ